MFYLLLKKNISLAISFILKEMGFSYNAYVFLVTIPYGMSL